MNETQRDHNYKCVMDTEMLTLKIDTLRQRYSESVYVIVENHYNRLRTRINMKTDTAMLKLENFKWDLVGKIQAQRQALREHMSQASDTLSMFKQLIQESEAKYEKFIETLDDLKNNNKSTEKTLKNMAVYSKFLFDQSILFDAFIFNNKKPVLTENPLIQIQPMYIVTLRKYQMYNFDRMTMKEFDIETDGIFRELGLKNVYSHKIVLFKRTRAVIAVISEVTGVKSIEQRSTRYQITLAVLDEPAEHVPGAGNLSQNLEIQQSLKADAFDIDPNACTMSISMTQFKEFLVVGISKITPKPNESTCNLSLFDEFLNKLKSIDFPFGIRTMQSNDRELCITEIGLSEPMYTFDDALQLRRKIGQTQSENEPFYFSAHHHAPVVKNDFLYVMSKTFKMNQGIGLFVRSGMVLTNKKSIRQLSFETGKLLNVFDCSESHMNMSSFGIISNSYILFYDMCQSLYIYVMEDLRLIKLNLKHSPFILDHSNNDSRMMVDMSVNDLTKHKTVIYAFEINSRT
jgi:hypothetical protein